MCVRLYKRVEVGYVNQMSGVVLQLVHGAEEGPPAQSVDKGKELAGVVLLVECYKGCRHGLRSTLVDIFHARVVCAG